MSRLRPIVFVVFSALASGAMAQDELARGHALVEANCGRCHAVGPEGASPLPAAPLFRELGQRYPIADLEEALAEGIMTAHPEMPQFAFEPRDIDAILAYIQSLQKS